MKQTRMTSENGQVLVLLVLAIVALVAFMALAIDGGNTYSSRRTAQNAADSAALAGASHIANGVKNINNLNWKCNTLDTIVGDPGWALAKQAAISRANDNHYAIQADQATNTVTVTCVQGVEKYIDIFVQITQPVQTAFLQVLGVSQPVNTVNATVRIRPRLVYADGAAIVATRNVCSNVPGPSDGGINFNGNITAKITGGGIKSNDCCVLDGNSAIVNVTDGSWTCAGSITLNPNDPSANIQPPPTNGAKLSVDTNSLASRLTAACNSYPGLATNVSVKNNKTVTINPGKYTNIDVNGGGWLIMNPGLYCIYGQVLIDGKWTGNHITMFMPDLKSSKVSFTTTANADVTLTAPPLGCDVDVSGCNKSIGGLLVLYMPRDETNGTTPIFDISGNSISSYTGGIFVPNTAARITGNSDIASCDSAKNKMQLVAETVILSGTGDVCINYDPNFSVQDPAYMNLQK